MEKVKIKDIKIARRLTAIDDAKVIEFAGSINELGLLQNITITPNNELIGGLHRLKACELLGWEEIDAKILDLDELDTTLAQVEENSMRVERHYLEKGELLRIRKKIYEQKYPETKKGKAQARGMNEVLGYNVSAEFASTFSEDTAQKLNMSQRLVQELIQIVENLDPEVKQMVKVANINKSDALKLIRLSKGDPEIQKAAIGKLAAKQSKTIEQAIKAVKKTEPVTKKLPTSPLTLKEKILKQIQYRNLGISELQVAIEILKDCIKELEEKKILLSDLDKVGTGES